MLDTMFNKLLCIALCSVVCALSSQFSSSSSSVGNRVQGQKNPVNLSGGQGGQNSPLFRFRFMQPHNRQWKKHCGEIALDCH